MASLGQSLKARIRKLANTTSVDQLVKRGVKEVNVVGLDHIVSLIEQAVRHTLRSKLMGLDRQQIASATREEFLRLLERNEKLERSHSKAVELHRQAEHKLDELRRELAESHARLEERLALAERDQRARYEGEDRQIVEQVHEMFVALAGPGGPGLRDAQDRVIELVLDLVGNERRSAIEARQTAHDREVDNLQRRIHKLKTTLQATETHLSQIAAQGTVDQGISSIYREVQGLDPAERYADRKRELMSEIFEANLELQKGQEKP